MHRDGADLHLPLQPGAVTMNATGTFFSVNGAPCPPVVEQAGCSFSVRLKSPESNSSTPWSGRSTPRVSLLAEHKQGAGADAYDTRTKHGSRSSTVFGLILVLLIAGAAFAWRNHLQLQHALAGGKPTRLRQAPEEEDPFSSDEEHGSEHEQPRGDGQVGADNAASPPCKGERTLQSCKPGGDATDKTNSPIKQEPEREHDVEDDDEAAVGSGSGWFAERAAVLRGDRNQVASDSNDDEFLVPSLRRADDDDELRSLKRSAMNPSFGLMPLD